ncbi:leucyl aminopeptidase [Saccharolobus solfataricus]|uniref:Probable aminopeptidase 1 n=3 Tax=Saccharolobus solfataricus TaxID=2287 RepID=APE1_SACS2|nr:M1 family metallopeptidase [Saccharolobus solfataricus]Q97VF1.1 RecName: Full=Probable aminopeptidase 1 [Saccharolobus solfataricus P2]AAK42793.1 Tricorn protease interacting factor F3 [Saccharolobus solfataricus P2]AKA72885.1 leucyl aminopeptidase [Saccharolobus solfataricus]AKA75584.1 leucyl aminopeptidase [Saccharolobus solfataricus]AKA78277.1 leucyl aminopeptidase [Saccharolobus solfataricus]AZF67395.1 leucyl aminopeptidase [Saccharolobus solfataricus]
MPNIEKYEIFLDFNGNEYEGVEKIYLNSEEEKLELDSVNLEIRSVKSDGKDTKFELKGEKLVIYGKIERELEIKFKGKASRDSILGIYVAPYDGKGMITTQFEAVYARRFIPCFDHPAMKARFKLSVRVQKGLKVISNMPVERIEEDVDGKVIYRFQETPKMSTYLLYLGIDEFEEISDNSKQPTVILATVPGKSKRGLFAINVARKVIEFYEKYFEIPYQLPKVHLIQVPEFAAGAMENWGAITFRETALLADDSSSISQKFRVAEVVAHELAHQWFGNLVTLKWWDDLWLNESFATFMSYKSIKHLFPQWDSEGHLIYDESIGALEDDSLSTTHPIEAHVKDPHEIEQMFDNISYGKGASILKMIEAYVGEENFRRGVVNYLNSFKFGNAEGKDLWNSISNAAGQSIGEIMADWITKPGYPVIFVNAYGNSIRFSQKRFTLLDSGLNEVYKVPITYEINDKFGTLLLDKESAEIRLDEGLKSIKVNINRTGFYRVLYDSLNLAFSSKLNAYEELGLVNDYWNFLLADLIDAKTYFGVIGRFVYTSNSFVSREITSQLLTLYYLFKKNYGKDFLVNQVKIFRKANDDLGKLAYSTVISALARMDEEFALGLSTLFDQYENIDSNIKEAVAIAYAVTNNDFNTLLEKYKRYTIDEEKNRILSAISSLRDPSIVVKVFSLIFERNIKAQDTRFVISSLLHNPHIREEVCSYLMNNFEEVKKFVNTVYGGPWGLGSIVRSMSFCGVDKPKDIIDFLEKVKFKEIERPIKESEERIKVYSRLKQNLP